MSLKRFLDLYDRFYNKSVQKYIKNAKTQKCQEEETYKTFLQFWCVRRTSSHITHWRYFLEREGQVPQRLPLEVQWSIQKIVL